MHLLTTKFFIKYSIFYLIDKFITILYFLNYSFLFIISQHNKSSNYNILLYHSSHL